MWKNWEAGKITALMMDLDIGVVSEVEKKQKKKLLLGYLYDNLKNHNWSVEVVVVQVEEAESGR